MPANAKTPRSSIPSPSSPSSIEKRVLKVGTLLRTAKTDSEPLLMNEINVGEVFYIIAKTRSLERAEDFLHRLETLQSRQCPIPSLTSSKPPGVKAQFPLSYADAFAISTALRSQAMVVTGDPEFRTVAHLVEILWL